MHGFDLTKRHYEKLKEALLGPEGFLVAIYGR